MNNLKKILTLSLAVWLISAALPATAAVYDIDPDHTTVGFQIRHLAISKVHGAFGDYTGTFTYDPAHPGATEAEAVIQVASVDTNNEKRDEHLRSAEFFDAEKYPTMTFKSTSVKMKNDQEGEVTGNLTLHGQTHPVTLDLEINGTVTDPWGNERVGASLSGTIDRTQWGLTYNSVMEAGGLVVGDDVKISIELEAIKRK